MKAQASRGAMMAIVAAVAGAFLGSSIGAYATDARVLSWPDLVPRKMLEIERDAVALEQSMAKRAQAERDRFWLVGQELELRQRLADGAITQEDLDQRERALLADALSKDEPEAVAFWAEVRKTRDALEALDKQVEPKLDGAQVRIPGYALPLELDGERVTQFLLVPYVGACIHTPPPPPNQMVFVTMRDGFTSEGLFQPVWVEGKLAASGGSYDLSLVDGSSAVDAGYSLQASVIEPYKQP